MSFYLTALTAVSNTAFTFDKLFSYRVPPELCESVKVGCRVLVPFGKGNKYRTAMIFELNRSDMPSDTDRLKIITSQIDYEPVLSEELLELAIYLKSNTFCTYYEAVKAMLPPGMNIKISEQIALNTEFSDVSSLNTSESEIYRLLSQCKNSEIPSLAEKILNDGKASVISSLIKKNALSASTSFKSAVGDNTVKMIRLSEKYVSSPSDFKLTPKQKIAASLLSECGSASVKELAYMCGVTDTVVKRLAANGAAEEYECEILRNVEVNTGVSRCTDDIVLSDEQQSAFNSVAEVLQKNVPACFLLHGVTGSGKTSVFEKLIDYTVKHGKQALLLIPEISLTPQILKRFRGLFGEKVAVIHSSLSLGQRLDEYKRIKRGDADIVVGTRSAIFAPLDNIGIIIMDEEGEHSYKSDSAPRYNTVDVAKQRCRKHLAVLLLASATPTIESYYNAGRGIYKLIEMKNRYHAGPMPQVEIVDMNIERSEGNATEFSRRLVEEITLNLEKGEQTILLLNRRGYHTIISCCDCYQPIYCPNCTVPMTFHKTNGKLMCHYCGYTSDMLTVCPKCGSERLKKMGFGTQKLEEELSVFFPTARILRMDADTTFSRYAYEKSFADFENGKYDIMIGTQMISKGLDFPNVTLVGVMSVDKALFAGDFRSYERTFSLITQVVGRGGRGQKQGRAVLQTFMPDNYVMELAARQDYNEFYNQEIAIRRAMIFPPICDMCIIGLSGSSDELTKSAADETVHIISEKVNEHKPDSPLRVLGPVKCAYGKINGKYRYRIILKCKNTPEIRELISTVVKTCANEKEFTKISIYADMNGDIGV